MIITKIFPFAYKSRTTLRSTFHKSRFFATTAKVPPKQCYYKVLNISTDATPEEIKKSYLELAKKYHPDVMTGETVQEGKFVQISEAYQILSDPQKRQQYDFQNGIITRKRRPEATGPGSGDNEWNSSTDRVTSEKEKEELDNYFQKKYFQNKDYFKYKQDEDPWNLTRKLYNQHIDKKEEKEGEYVLFHPHSPHAYYAHKDELKYSKDIHVALRVIYDYRLVILSGIILAVIFGVGGMFIQNKEDEKKKSKSNPSMRTA